LGKKYFFEHGREVETINNLFDIIILVQKIVLRIFSELTSLSLVLHCINMCFSISNVCEFETTYLQKRQYKNIFKNCKKRFVSKLNPSSLVKINLQNT
jgi:hypothetical protein